MFTLEELQKKRDSFCRFLNNQEKVFFKEIKDTLATQIADIMFSNVNESSDCYFSPKLLAKLKKDSTLLSLYIMDNVQNKDMKYLCAFGISMEKIAGFKIEDVHLGENEAFITFLIMAGFKIRSDSYCKVNLIPPKSIIDILQWWEKNQKVT